MKSVILVLAVLSLLGIHHAQPQIAVAPQYDTTHVYVAPEDTDRFAASFIATFGGKSTKQVVVTVTPTPSLTTSQLIQTPVGTVSLFGFKSPIPFPFGNERTGYLVTDLDEAIKEARADGADVIVAPFPDPIGRDAIIQWPGGVNMQLYWHTVKPSYPPLQTIPENRVYISPDRANSFIRSFTKFSHGSVTLDHQEDAVAIGLPGKTYRRVEIKSNFGQLTLFVTDGHLPFPYGRETTGYEVLDLADTLKRANAAGVTTLVSHFNTAMVQFPGGYIAEIHGRLP